MARKRRRKRLLKGASNAALMLAVAPGVLRRLDHRRDGEKGGGCESLATGEELKGVTSGDGTRIWADCCGEAGPTIFFVHGWTCNGTIFRYQKPFFGRNYQVVTLDLRGHGRSAVPESRDYHPDRLAEDLKAVIDAVDPEEFVIAGHSMGGFTAFKFHEHFGEEYGGRLKGLVIIDSTGTDLVDGLVLGRLVDKFYPVPLNGLLKALGWESRLATRILDLMSDSSAAYLIVRWAAFGKKPPAGEVELVREMTFSTPVESIALAAKGCLDFHCEYHLPEVDMPVLILVGSEDKLTNRYVNLRTCEALPQAELVVFEEAGHCIQLERTEEFNLALDDFLSGCFNE